MTESHRLQRDNVAVLIPALNEALRIREVVLAALEQSANVIVVDDGSDDGTADVVSRYGERLTYGHQPNGGNGSARNHAVRLATGDLYAFLDADDIFVPDKLALQVAVLEAEPFPDVVFGHVQEFVSPELTGEQAASVRPPAPEPMPWTAPNLMLITRTAFERVGEGAPRAVAARCHEQYGIEPR